MTPYWKKSRRVRLALFVMAATAGLFARSHELKAQDDPATEAITGAAKLRLDQRLADIVSLNFEGATLAEATSALALKSKELDPDHKGINFIIDPEASKSARPISLNLNNVPLREVLRYVCELARVKFKVDNYAIAIIPFNRGTDELISRTFLVGPGFVAPAQTSATDANQ